MSTIFLPLYSTHTSVWNCSYLDLLLLELVDFYGGGITIRRVRLEQGRL